MVDTREKLIELFEHYYCPLFMVIGRNMEGLADYLIANGVTVVPVHPDLHKAVRKLNEQYEHSKNSPYVKKPVAHALFKVWRWAD